MSGAIRESMMQWYIVVAGTDHVVWVKKEEASGEVLKRRVVE